MRQAITTKYIGPTDFRGARVSARCQAKRISVPWDDAKSDEDNHLAAAEELAYRMEWHGGRWQGGALPDGSGYCFVEITTTYGAFSVVA